MRRFISLLILGIMALTAKRAVAVAPIIDYLKPPIIGNNTSSATQAAPYIYPDAFDIRVLSHDDSTTSDALKWSYEIIGTPKYAINGVPPVNSSVPGETLNPPDAKNFNKTMNSLPDADDPNPDGLIQTVTLRNIELFPYGASPSIDQTTATQDWTRNMQPVTFWCSDGDMATSQTVMFYTDNTYLDGKPTGFNRLSGHTCPPQPPPIPVRDWPVYDSLSGHCTTKTWTDGKGICFEVAHTGNNWGSVASPMGAFRLIDNMIYRIRAKMNCSQATPGKTPFWDFIIENWNGDGERGLNLYGMDNFYLDNEGGANAIVSRATGTEVQMIWAPAAFQTPQWRSMVDGIFAVNPKPPLGNGKDYHLKRDAQVRFRVLDIDSNTALLNNFKSGAICLQTVILETAPLSRKVYTSGPAATPPTADLYLAATPKGVHNNPADKVPGNMMAGGLTGSIINYSGGALTITPAGSARIAEIVQVTPATDTRYIMGDWSTIDDDWPIPWQSGRIYELEVKLSAPTQNDADHPFDVIWMNMEPPTNEVISESYVTANHAIATPRPGVPQAYYMFYYSGNETRSTIPAFHSLRWRLRFGNSENLNWPDPANTLNTGAVRVHSVRVNTVDFR